MIRAILAALVTGLQIGAALVASEAVVADVGAGRLGFVRYAIALVLLLPVALLSRGPRIARADLLPVALIGMGQFGVLVALLNLAVLYTGSARVALVFATLPIVTMVLGLGTAGGRVSRLEGCSIVMSVIGVAVLLGGDALVGNLETGDLIGLGCAFAATLVGALCSLLYRPYLKRSGVKFVGVVAMTASLLPLGLIGMAETQGIPMADWSSRTVLIVGFVGVSSGFGFVLWLYALANLPAPTVTAFVGLSPVTAAVLSIVFLDVVPTPTLLGAMILILASLAVTAIAQRSSHRKSLPVAAA